MEQKNERPVNNDEIIKIIDLNKKFTERKSGEKLVLNNINLSLSAPGIYGFYGPNGAGKTMLFRAISGLIHPSSGEVWVEGELLGRDTSYPRSLGLIIENVGFWPEYSGFDNLRILASIKKIINDDDIRLAIKRVGLDPDSKQGYGKYSLGMKQRLAIAQAIMEKPDLIILDEPTNSLDYDGIEEIRDIIREEKERGATILIASHNREDLENLCSRFFRISDGVLQETTGIEAGYGKKGN